MGYWMIFAQDKENMADTRLANRAAHLAYLQNNGNDKINKLAFGSPLGQEVMDGSLLVVEASSLSAVEEFADNDPYNIAGIFDSIIIKPLHANFNAEKFVK